MSKLKVGTVMDAKKVECGHCGKIFLMGLYSMLESPWLLKWSCPECKSMRDGEREEAP